MKKLAKALLVFPIIVFLLNGCTEPLEEGLPGSESDPSYFHSTGWKDDPQHGIDYSTNPQNCTACHGQNLEGGPSGVSCASCHHSGWNGTHGEAFAEDPNNCKTCHGEDLDGDGDQDRDCGFCHHEEAIAPWQHGDYHTQPDTDDCTDCHGADFEGGNTYVSCFSCHAIDAFDCDDCHTGPASAYADSAHGNTAPGYGVNRSGTGYAVGDCTQCHDLPDGSEKDLLLFADMNQTSQDNNFCFRCHTDTGSVQDGGIINRDYSGTFGGALDGVTGIKEAFNQLSYHNLDDILNFATDEWPSTFTGASNACSACHNVHIARQNKENPGDPTYTAISRPSDHDNLWGDGDPDERMTAPEYGDYYQPPYHTSPKLEPDGAGSDRATQAGKTPDYVTFCQDCHTSPMTDYGLTHTDDGIDWTTTGDESNLPDSAGGDKHGKNIATGNVHYLEAPYAGAWTASGLVLSCTDCHEPHGAPNEMLIRGEANGAQVTIGTIGTDDMDLRALCERCHNYTWNTHHNIGEIDLNTPPYDFTSGACTDCHPDGQWDTGAISICSNCHFHGGDDSWLKSLEAEDFGIVNGNSYYTGRRTF